MLSSAKTDYGMPVFQLQQMLREIFQVYGMEPEVIPDGIFGETTESAVKAFQSMQGLGETGVVDNETWDLILEVHERARIEGEAPIAVQLFTTEDLKVGIDTTRARLAVLQAMMQVMQLRFPNLPQVDITGVYDVNTAEAVRKYRLLFGMEEGNGADNLFWYHFSKAYESAVLPHDFENPENNRYKPEEARQQIDLHRRTEKSMPERMPDELLESRAQDAQINLLPMLDSYQSLREENQTEEEKVLDTKVEVEPKVVGKQTRAPLKWRF